MIKRGVQQIIKWFGIAFVARIIAYFSERMSDIYMHAKLDAYLNIVLEG